MFKTPVPVHTHSTYDALDGMISHQDLIDFAKKEGLESLCITQHGNFDGWVKFYKICLKNNINPVIGLEAYMTQTPDSKESFHMVIIPKDFEELKILFKINNEHSIMENFFRKPRVLFSDLNKLKNSYILTGCLASIFNKKRERMNEMVAGYKRGLGDRFFLEIMPNSDPEQKEYNLELVRMAEKHKVELILTTDSHYPTRESALAQGYMMAAAMHKKYKDMTYFKEADFFLYTGEDIEKAIDYIDPKILERAIENTYKITKSVKLNIPIKLRLPSFTGSFEFYEMKRRIK